MDNIFPKLHKEGYKFLAISIIITFIVWIFSNFLAMVMLLITIWVYYFFRDPERISINDNSFLVSPADGLITDISERSGPEELRLENTTYTKISIFMNVFNCHVNRVPVSGKVEEIFTAEGPIFVHIHSVPEIQNEPIGRRTRDPRNRSTNDAIKDLRKELGTL